MTPTRLLAAAVVALTLTACGTSAERSARTQRANVAWLSGNGQPARIDLTGSWFVPGWGGGYLAQTDNRITGYVDKFSISGVVNDRTVQLAIAKDGATRYSALVVPTSPDRLQGHFSPGVPYNPHRQTRITFEKLSR
jgi:hypothetical protein